MYNFIIRIRFLSILQINVFLSIFPNLFCILTTVLNCTEDDLGYNVFLRKENTERLFTRFMTNNFNRRTKCFYCHHGAAL